MIATHNRERCSSAGNVRNAGHKVFIPSGPMRLALTWINPSSKGKVDFFYEYTLKQYIMISAEISFNIYVILLCFL
jgi:hypothetical protein